VIAARPGDEPAASASACFETRFGCAEALVSMTEAIDGIQNVTSS
jgi:hypothetical protein